MPVDREIQTDRQIFWHADRNTSHPCRGELKTSNDSMLSLWNCTGSRRRLMQWLCLIMRKTLDRFGVHPTVATDDWQGGEVNEAGLCKWDECTPTNYALLDSRRLAKWWQSVAELAGVRWNGELTDKNYLHNVSVRGLWRIANTHRQTLIR